jgi:hypothetical protein
MAITENTAPVPAENLLDLASRINHSHRKCQEAANASITHALQAGQDLLRVKEHLRHGGFLAWVRQNCAFTTRHAQRYMKLARELADVTNATRESHLSIRQALELIAEAHGDDSEDKDTENVDGGVGTQNDDSFTTASPDVSHRKMCGQEGATGPAPAARRKNRGRSIREPQIEDHFAFGFGSPEVTELEELLEDLQKSACNRATRLLNRDLRVAGFTEDLVAQALLEKLFERLASLLGLELRMLSD